jgi:hypothetical protein
MITALKGTFPILSCQRTSEPSSKTLLLKVNRTAVAAVGLSHAFHGCYGLVKVIMKHGGISCLILTLFNGAY